MDWTELLGFVTGGLCVWLIVKENIWNWPIGLANNAFFFVLFLRSRLFADMGLQVVYFALGCYGWINWLRAGARVSPMKITRMSRVEAITVGVVILPATWGLREILIVAQGAAPFWDALTSVLSLIAQYLLCRKRLENWVFWIIADLIYIPLYISRGLPLTSILYGIFLAMCLVGFRDWLRSWSGARAGGEGAS